MLRGADEHGAKKRSFAFALVYIKCFRAYSVYLSLRHGVFILYTPCHLPPQREARALPRRAPKLTASERKIVTKETHQGCVFIQGAFALQRRGESAPAPCAEFLLMSIKSRGWCGFSPRVGIFTKIYIKNSPPRSEKAQKESSGPFAVGYSEKTPCTTVQRTPTFPRPTANGSCGGSIPQNACFGTEWKG